MADHTQPQHPNNTDDDDSSSLFLPPHQPSDLPRKGSKLETLSHQPFKKKPKTLNLSEQGQFNGDDKTLVKPDSQLPNSSSLGKQQMDTDNDMHNMIDMELLDDFNSGENALDSEDDGSGYGFVANDNDEFDEITSRHQLKYTNLCEDEIQQRQEEDIARIATVLSISRASACCLLRHYNWSVSNVHDAWFADEENVRKTVGLLEKPTLLSPNAKKMTCGICFETHQLSSMSAAVCGHYFCASCWKGYIGTSIKDGPGCLMLRCPDPSCAAAVGQDMINLLVSDKDKAKYSRYLLRSYIEDNKRIKWCPAPGCDFAVEFVGSGSYDVSCNCAYNFCWNCLQEVHRPVDCDTVAKWLSKNTAESGNVNWILAYSKPCPKCKRPIEKNMGCMHMSCPAPCSFQFCWLCLGSWESHYHRSGRVNPCNGYNKVKQEGASNDDEARREMAKKSLEKYTHYFERWDANQKSRQKAILDLQQMQTVHIEELSNRQCQLTSQLKFITEAWQQIIECRRVLKWTYAYGYYLPQHEDTKRQLFEYLQGEAESGLERLHQCAEQDLRVFLNAEEPCKGFNEFRIKLAGLTTVTRNYFENLVQALENGLADVNSHGASSKTDSSKGSGGNNKGGKYGKGKGTTSKSGVVGRDLNDPMGSWFCEHCSFSNNNSATICQMCNQRRGSWSCEHCTFFNRRSATICQMCEQER